MAEVLIPASKEVEILYDIWRRNLQYYGKLEVKDGAKEGGGADGAMTPLGKIWPPVFGDIKIKIALL